MRLPCWLIGHRWKQKLPPGVWYSSALGTFTCKHCGIRMNKYVGISDEVADLLIETHLRDKGFRP